jgi:hypothetical protein
MATAIMSTPAKIKILIRLLPKVPTVFHPEYAVHPLGAPILPGTHCHCGNMVLYHLTEPHNPFCRHLRMDLYFRHHTEHELRLIHTFQTN